MEGYDAKFDPPLDKRLECPICLLAQRDPLQTPCGHRFCASCILRALRETGPRCPVDNTRVSNHNLFRDNFAKREVLSLKVKCAAVDLGCSWKGELRDLEPHLLSCDLVCIDCPNSCGHSCQRKDMSPHIGLCSNKPEQCPTCSIHFTRNKVQLHRPHCSKIVIPESILSNLFKANEVLKWTGHIKWKMTKRYHSLLSQLGASPISCYLTAKMDSAEAHLFCGNWQNTLSMFTLDSHGAKVFMRTLQGPEVQSKSFNFSLLCNDSRCAQVNKILKKKVNDISALLGWNLTANVNRNDLTVLYIHWSEQKKRTVALVAELKAHLVRQMQSRLQSVQGANSRRNRAGPPHQPAGRVHHQNRAYQMAEYASMLLRQHPEAALGAGPPPPPPGHHQGGPPPPPQVAPPPQHHPHPHPHPQSLHTRMHPRQPTLGIVTQGPPPPPPNSHSRHHPQQQQHNQQQQSYHQLQSSQLFQENSAQSYPRILSWQMSRNLSGYPWRVQHDNVPFFTFPSTPPSFLPANHYPYTFAPPISINQIPPGTAGPVPSYAGIAVPSVTGVDAVVSGATFPVAALTSLTELPREQLHNVPPGAVAVTIANSNHPVTGQTVVIQQTQEPGIQNQDVAVFQAVPHQPTPPQHPIHMHPGHAQYHPPAGAAGIIQPGPGVIQHGSLVATVQPPQLISVPGGPHHASVMGVSLAHSVPPTSDPAQSQRSWRGEREGLNPRGDRQHPPSVRNSETTMGRPSSQYPPSLVQSGSQSSGFSGPHRPRATNSATIALVTDEPGPSRLNTDPASPSNNSSDSDSPSTQLSSILYGRRIGHYDDSDDSSSPDLDSGDSLSYQHDRQMSDLSGEGQLTSDGDVSSGLSDSESDEVTNPSTLRMINSNSAVVNVRPSQEASEGQSSSDAPSIYILNEASPSSDDPTEMVVESSDSNSMNLPPLINISSDPETPISRSQTPPSIIDLTVLSTNSSPSQAEASASTATDQRMYRGERSARVPPSNLFNREPSSEVIVVPPPSHHQLPVAAELEEPALNNAAGSFVITSTPDMPRMMGVVATSQGPPDFHQMAQPHSHQQHYIALASQQPADPASQIPQHHTPQVPQHHAHPPAGMLHGHHPSRHSHATGNQPAGPSAASSMFQFPPSAPPPPPHIASGDGRGVAIQQVSNLPPPVGPAPMETVPPPVNPHGVHVLTWQQTLQAGELVPGHGISPAPGATVASAVVLPAPPPTAQPMGEAVMASHHHMQADAGTMAVIGLQQPQQQAAPTTNEGGAAAAATATAGNFWETVMPSLDLSLQSNLPAESSTHH